MLQALGDPLSLLLLVASFLAAVVLHGWVQGLVAARTGDRAAVQAGRTRPSLRAHLDPFGAVAAALAGVGWAKPLEPAGRRSTGALVATLLSGSIANLVVGFAALAGVRLAGGRFPGASTFALQSGVGGDLLLRALLLFGLMNVFVGLLSLVPLPPLDGGRLLFALAPRTEGWRKAEHQLDERNIGIAIVLALLLLPLVRSGPLLLFVLDTLAGPLLDLVLSG